MEYKLAREENQDTKVENIQTLEMQVKQCENKVEMKKHTKDI